MTNSITSVDSNLYYQIIALCKRVVDRHAFDSKENRLQDGSLSILSDAQEDYTSFLSNSISNKYI